MQQMPLQAAKRNNRKVDRKWSRYCIQNMKPNGVGVRKIFNKTKGCASGNYEHLVDQIKEIGKDY